MDSIIVLMSTYNGEKYIHEQLESIYNQENVNLKVIVRDDGSKDKTLDILSSYEKERKLQWYSGSNLRSARSFMDLIFNAPDADYYAFSDQDDVWNHDKLSRAIRKLKEIGNEEIPKLYCSNYQLVDENLIELSDNGHQSTTTFNEALVSSCCTGCTVVFNRTLLNYLKRGIPDHILMHDDWVHKVCLAIGGKVCYDEEKTLKYRQHGNNVDGGIHSKSQKIRMVLQRIKNKDCIRSNQIKDLLKLYEDDMTEEYKDMALQVANYRNKNLISRIRLAFSKKIKTNQRRLNKGFRLAIIFKYF